MEEKELIERFFFLQFLLHFRADRTKDLWVRIIRVRFHTSEIKPDIQANEREQALTNVLQDVRSHSRSAPLRSSARGRFTWNAAAPVARPLTRGTHMLAPRVTHVLARREACRVSAHANKVELVPLCTRWLENNVILLSLEVELRSASLENVLSFPRRFAVT